MNLGRFFGLGTPVDAGGAVAVLRGWHGLGLPPDEHTAQGMESLEEALIAAGHARRALDIEMGCDMVRQTLFPARRHQVAAQVHLEHAGEIPPGDQDMIHDQVRRLDTMMSGVERDYLQKCGGAAPARQAPPMRPPPGARMGPPPGARRLPPGAMPGGPGPGRGGPPPGRMPDVNPEGMLEHFRYEVTHHEGRMNNAVEGMATHIDRGNCRMGLMALLEAVGARDVLLTMTQGAYMFSQAQGMFNERGWQNTIENAKATYLERCARDEPTGGGDDGGGDAGPRRPRAPLLEL